MNVEAAIQALVDAGVEFVIIGGWSAILNGSAYITNDLDICYARNPQNLRSIAQALAPYHPRLSDLPAGLPFVWDAATLRNGTVCTLNTDLGKVDLLAEVAGLGTYEEMTVGSVATEAFGRQVQILNIESLIKANRAAGTVKDLLILPELESLLEAQEP